MEPNPGLIQPPSASHANSTPLVLFHDGGGTTLSYYRLGSLNRTVYGIADPCFFTGRSWSGLPQMAKIYANLIRATIPVKGKQKILLGGWSLGGLIALEVARILESDGQFHVAGVVMIDSPYPHSLGLSSDIEPGLFPPKPFFHAHCSPELRMLVTRSIQRGCKLVSNWTVPDWSSESKTFRSSGVAPPVLLLRCQEYVPHGETAGDETPPLVLVDRSRHLRMLGWEMTDGLVCGVLDIPGHHFNVMWEKNLDAITGQLKLACEMLDMMATR